MRIQLAVFLCLMGMALCGAGERLMVTLQRGLDDYDGVEDTLLYAPNSVANINYGDVTSVGTGINRWGEHLVVLLRFDLRDIPREAEVLKAALLLFDTSKDRPSKDLRVDIQAVAQANAAWEEGENDGTRVPVPGTCCWNYLRYDSEPWAGTPGLREEGVDYLMPLAGSALVPKGREGWIEFPLKVGVVQGWVDGSGANAGVRVFPLGVKDKGEYVTMRTSEYLDDVATRPKLVLELSIADAPLAQYRQNVARRVLRRTEEQFEVVRAQVAERGSPARAVALVNGIEERLHPIRDACGATLGLPKERQEELTAQLRQIRAGLTDVVNSITPARAAAANEARGLPTDLALGIADSMMNVLRPAGLFEGGFERVAHLELAKNEFEAVQVIIVPIDANVTGATWSVTDLTGPDNASIPAEDVTVQVMGYMKKIKPSIPTDVDWWPAPILDFMDRVDVPQGEVQPLWVCVHAREDTPAGAYRGTVTIEATNAAAKTVELEVRVFDFAVPKEQHLLTVWGNNEATYKTLYGERYDKAMARRMFDFLIDHRLAVNSLYAVQSAGEPGILDSVGYPTLSDPAELKRLWDAGSRWWNLGYLHPLHAKSAEMELDAYVPHFIDMIRESLRVADAAGWPHGHLGIYFFDETRDFEALNRAALQVKEAFPDIALMTTGYDRSYGVKNGPIDASIDIWCPLTPRFVLDQHVIAEGRKLGKKAWWYVCCGPAGNRSLNFFCQYPAIRSRLLMGAAAWKYQPDGFLYYRISGWRYYDKPIDSGPLTAWKAYHQPGPDGDGELICPGPNGPLSTLQFENLRDGIEDFEYYWVLADLLKRASDAGIQTDAEQALLNVPETVLTSLTAYSENSRTLRNHRRQVAEAIVALRRRIEAAEGSSERNGA